MLRLFYFWSMLAATIHGRIDSERGATAVEYGVMLALILAVVIVTVATIGTRLEEAFNTVCNQLTGGGTC